MHAIVKLQVKWHNVGPIEPTNKTQLRLATESLHARKHRKELAEIAGAQQKVPHHSLLAELGTAIVRFREIIVFNGARVYPEYLIAYSRDAA
jgi:hypothetical protein